MSLWIRITEAYGRNDVKALAELEVLARKALKDLEIDGVTNVEIPDLEERISRVRDEIEEIKTKEPYTYRALLEDEEAAEKKKQELQKELEEYRNYHKELTEIAEKILREDNKFDSNAVLILTADKKKLGYIPEKDNIIFARLMDAGKMLAAKIKGIEKKGSFTKIAIGIYLVDF
jgi:predicted  nucleic acid-binding Zn-ribbon protein